MKVVDSVVIGYTENWLDGVAPIEMDVDEEGVSFSRYIRNDPETSWYAHLTHEEFAYAIKVWTEAHEGVA